MNSGGVGTVSSVYFPFYSTAILKVLNILILWVNKGKKSVYNLLPFCTLSLGLCCCFTVYLLSEPTVNEHVVQKDIKTVI